MSEKLNVVEIDNTGCAAEVEWMPSRFDQDITRSDARCRRYICEQLNRSLGALGSLQVSLDIYCSSQLFVAVADNHRCLGVI